MGDVVQFNRRTYSAKPVRFQTDLGYTFAMSGTLDGYIDFSITYGEVGLTYLLTQADAHHVITGLHAVCRDIQDNCLYDRDQLLEPE